MAKWIAAENVRAGQRNAVLVLVIVLNSMPERDGKDSGNKSPKQACSCWFARHS